MHCVEDGTPHRAQIASLVRWYTTRQAQPTAAASHHRPMNHTQVILGYAHNAPQRDHELDAAARTTASHGRHQADV